MSKTLIARPANTMSKAEICELHKQEWQLFRTSVLAPAADSGDKDAAAFAKSIADSIRLAQEGERKAMDMGAGEGDNVIIVRWADAQRGNNDGGDAA